jgi:hypothetical protein
VALNVPVVVVEALMDPEVTSVALIEPAVALVALNVPVVVVEALIEPEVTLVALKPFT